MDFPCESEINVRNENALRFSILSKPAPIIEYLKTIASLIGASHILGVFESEDFIKVYFDDKKYVDTLIRSGIHVLGHHIKVDYVVPPANKVVLSNIDPVVSNYDLIRLMSMFGSVVSPVFRSPISDDAELCHIDYGVRYVYIDLNTPVPETLEFKYGDQMCKINVKLDDSLTVSPEIKKETIELNPMESSPNVIAFNENSEAINIDDLDITDPVVLSVQSAAEELNSTEHQNGDIEGYTETNNFSTKNHNLRKARQAKLMKTSRIKNRNKHSVKYKNRKPKRFTTSKNKEPIAPIKESPETPLNTLASSSADAQFSANLDCSLTSEDSLISQNSKNILEENQLALFLDEVRCQRAPIELAKKYLGSSFDSNALLCLIQQLKVYKKKLDDVSVKVRINRLINNLKNFLDNNK